MAIEIRGNWTDLVGGVGLQIFDVFDQGMEEYIPGISNLLQVRSGTGAQENYTGKTGAGRATEFDGEGESIKETRRYKTYTTKVVWNNIGSKIRVSKNQVEDRDFENELNEARDLGISMQFSKDESGMQLFNGGFTTTTKQQGYTMTLYGDGVPTFSTVHPSVVPGASTQSNASSTGITLTDGNLETARVAMVLQQTDDGLPLALMGNTTLVVPMNLEKEAKVITMSDRVSGSDFNNINVYKGAIDMVSSQFLDATNGGSNTAWYLVVPGRTKFYHGTRQEAQMNQDVNIENQVMTFTVDSRFANYVLDWRRSYGSKGDSAAYSS